MLIFSKYKDCTLLQLRTTLWAIRKLYLLRGFHHILWPKVYLNFLSLGMLLSVDHERESLILKRFRATLNYISLCYLMSPRLRWTKHFRIPTAKNTMTFDRFQSHLLKARFTAKALKLDESLLVDREYDNMDRMLYCMLSELCLFWVSNLNSCLSMEAFQY